MVRSHWAALIARPCQDAMGLGPIPELFEVSRWLLFSRENRSDGPTAFSRRSLHRQPRGVDFTRLQAGHGAKKNDQRANGYERERRTREKLRRSVETLSAPRLHKGDQRQNKADAVTDQRDHDHSLRGITTERTGHPAAHQPEPEEEK